MKSFMRYLYTIIGSILIAFSIQYILVPNNFATFGFEGLSSVLYYLKGTSISLNLLILNVLFLLISVMFLEAKVIRTYLLPSLLIPLFIFIFDYINLPINLEFPEKMLIIIAGGSLSGIGYSIIYKQGFSAGITFLIEELFGKITHFHSKFYSWIFDIIVIVLIYMAYDYQLALYSLVCIYITKYLITKARFGISDSKMFYIITSKEKEVKNFIIHDLKYELTVLDVKGGFSNKKKKILLSVISSSDYYKLKEGVKLIDDKSFIAITDTYDVVNRRNFK